MKCPLCSAELKPLHFDRKILNHTHTPNVDYVCVVDDFSQEIFWWERLQKQISEIRQRTREECEFSEPEKGHCRKHGVCYVVCPCSMWKKENGK